MGCGWIALGLGAAGIVLPVLPTAPFVLLAAACFMRSSQHLHDWVVGHPLFGEHIRGYLAGEGLSRRVKAAALGTLWASTLLSVVVVVPLPAVDAALVAVAVAVSGYILRLPSATPASPVSGQ